MGDRTFEEDLNIGDYFEEVIRRQMCGEHDIYKTTGNFKHYDLICMDCFQRFECKYDLILATTGNFCFEAPTLLETQADWLVYGWRNTDRIINNMAYVFNTTLLKDWIFNNPDKLEKKLGGDFNYELFLVPEVLAAEMPCRAISIGRR